MPDSAAPPVRRLGGFGEPWLHCPRCRYPLVRWAQYQGNLETPQLVWDSDLWWLPVPWEGLALATLILGAVPMTAILFVGGRRRRLPGQDVLKGLGFVWAGVYALIEWRRARLEGQLRLRDWVCAACLYAQNGDETLWFCPEPCNGLTGQPRCVLA
jgi:hypothetical protein